LLVASGRTSGPNCSHTPEKSHSTCPSLHNKEEHGVKRPYKDGY